MRTPDREDDGPDIELRAVAVTDYNPEGCRKTWAPNHDDDHRHGPDCGHEAVHHGAHVDYVVDGRLHRPHDDHCDDHGPVE